MTTEKIKAVEPNKIFDSTVLLADNAMLKVRPDLFDQWDFEKNNDLGLDVYKVTKGSGKKAWWICVKGHSHAKKIAAKLRVGGCPICSNNQLLVGFNDMWTTNPELASLLANPEDGHRHMQASRSKVDWKCPQCKSNIQDRAIYAIKKQGLSCPVCSDGIDYPEKFVSNILNQVGLDYYHDSSREWSNNKRYDFYIPELNCIIETHGDQHKRNTGFKNRTFEEEVENDRIKRENAFKNGITTYVELDCSISEMESIKASILNSELIEIIDFSEVLWERAEMACKTSVMITACEMFKNGLRVFEIAKSLKLSKNAIALYLKRGNNIGLVKYIPKTEMKKKVVQLDMNNNFIKEWDSLKDASDFLGVHQKGISAACSSKIAQKTAYGFKWLHKHDYIKYLEDGKAPSAFNDIHGCSVPIIQLDLESNPIREYKSMKCAAKELGLKNYAHISSCCRGKRKTAYGFKWMYKEIT